MVRNSCLISFNLRFDTLKIFIFYFDVVCLKKLSRTRPFVLYLINDYKVTFNLNKCICQTTFFFQTVKLNMKVH